jgi:hypothetical protein
MTYTHGDGDGIGYYQYFRDVVRESLNVVGRSAGPTVDYIPAGWHVR